MKNQEPRSATSLKAESAARNPGVEIVGNFKIVYPIFREDLAEALLIPIERKQNG
jgi:hypothetical protein